MLKGCIAHEQRIQAAIDLLMGADRIVCMTGAGISTPSGIPDFRSPQSGLWAQADPMAVASIWAFESNPRAFYQWLSPLAEKMLRVMPNPAHRALAELERMGRMQTIITHNVDGLHQKAGSTRVLELHGHLRDLHCIRCGHIEPLNPEFEEAVASARMLHCRHCGQVLKPTVVLFGELLPHGVFAQAQEAARDCDLLIVAGSSLEVAPASSLPILAYEDGAKLIIINFEPTPLDRLADLIIRDDVATVLPAIAAGIREQVTRS